MTLDRSRVPDAARVRPFTFPAWEGRQLANGINLMVIAEPRVPLVHFEFLIPIGADDDPTRLRGLTSLASGLLDEGTRTRSSSEIAESVEQLGASLFSTADWDGTYIGATSLSRHFAELFALVAEVVRTPSLPPEELDRLRGMRLADLVGRASQPAFVAGRQIADLTYGPDHPYGESVLGNATGIRSITRDDIEAWHRVRARPDQLTIIAVGDTTPEQMTELAQRHLSDWVTDVAPEARSLVAIPRGRARRIRIIDRPGAAQSELRIARVGLERSSPDYLSARFVSLILGGKFTSRLNLNLRERLGITYGVHCRLSGRRGPGPFLVSSAVDSEAVGTAVGEILGEFDRFAGGPLPADELDDARNYLLGAFPYRLQSLDDQADHLANIVLFGLEDDHYRTLPGRLSQLSTEAVEDCAGRLLQTDDLAIVAVGPAEILGSQLESFGPIELATDDSADASS